MAESAEKKLAWILPNGVKPRFFPALQHLEAIFLLASQSLTKRFIV
jgi:hypothetical protein